MRASTYLSFDGQCREAFGFYAGVLGAEVLMVLTWGETPMKDQVAQETHGKVAHMRMKVGPTLLMGSDAPPGRYSKMEGATVSVEVESPAEAKRVFDGLSDGGTVQMPMQPTFWSEAFGVLRDRYGIAWMVDCERPD